MKTKTSFLNLEKHDEDEFYDIGIHARNADRIDEAVKASDERVDTIEGKQNDLVTNQGDLGALQTTEKTSLVGAMNEVKEAIDSTTNDLSAVQDKISNIQNYSGKLLTAVVDGANANVTVEDNMVFTDGDKLDVKFSADVSAPVKVSFNGCTQYVLKDFEGNEADVSAERIYTLVYKDDDVDFFLCAPKGGADEWEDLTFVRSDYFHRLFYCDPGTDNLYELDSDTLLPINTVSSPGASPTGIGGTYNRLYHCDPTADNLYELDLDTLLPIKTVSSPSSAPTDIGGTYDRLFHCDSTADNLYELDVDTLLPINTVSSPSSTPRGIGGTYNRLYHCDPTANNLYELDLDTLLPINTVSSLGAFPAGIGGTYDRLFHCDTSPQSLYELDPDTLLPINTVSSPSTAPNGIGGIKARSFSITSVEFEESIYELTDDSPFRITGTEV